MGVTSVWFSQSCQCLRWVVSFVPGFYCFVWHTGLLADQDFTDEKWMLFVLKSVSLNCRIMLRLSILNLCKTVNTATSDQCFVFGRVTLFEHVGRFNCFDVIHAMAHFPGALSVCGYVQLAPIKLNRYGEDLLFFLFYMNGGDVLQLAAAAEL